jgi:hypothetical protein
MKQARLGSATMMREALNATNVHKAQTDQMRETCENGGLHLRRDSSSRRFDERDMSGYYTEGSKGNRSSDRRGGACFVDAWFRRIQQSS